MVTLFFQLLRPKTWSCPWFFFLSYAPFKMAVNPLSSTFKTVQNLTGYRPLLCYRPGQRHHHILLWLLTGSALLLFPRSPSSAQHSTGPVLLTVSQISSLIYSHPFGEIFSNSECRAKLFWWLMRCCMINSPLPFRSQIPVWSLLAAMSSVTFLNMSGSPSSTSSFVCMFSSKYLSLALSYFLQVTNQKS